MYRLEAGVYQPVIRTLCSILREHLEKVMLAKKYHVSEARLINSSLTVVGCITPPTVPF